MFLKKAILAIIFVIVVQADSTKLEDVDYDKKIIIIINNFFVKMIKRIIKIQTSDNIYSNWLNYNLRMNRL
jgi:hypothetical protein